MSGAWWETLYDEHCADVLLERDDPAEVERTVAFLIDALALDPGGRVFDQCCGIGSLAVPLAARGLEVIAVDQCEAYIARARRDAAARGVTVALHVADAFAFVPDRPCDAAFNWWTSFGYATDDRDNARMLSRAFEALRPGGRFALDVPNLAGVLRGFQPHVVTRRRTPRGEVLLVRESTVDLAAGALDKRWTYVLPDGRRVEHRSRLRLHLPHTIAELAAGVGFTDVTLLGGVDGAPLALDSGRCLLVATRPGAR
jgi:SAM-dependent methyltransferase